MTTPLPVALAWAILGFLFIVIAISVGINIVNCVLLSSVLKPVPQQFRKMGPWMVWLLLIPCFNLVWNFFVVIRIPASLKAYFNSIGRTDAGNCGRGLGLAYAICSVCSILAYLMPYVPYMPYMGLAVPIASVVLLIVFLVRVSGLKNHIAVQQG